MQINVPPVQPMPKVDVGELLLETVKAAPVLPVKLMDAVAAYAMYQSSPVMTIAGMDIKTDPSLPHDEVQFNHPDGRKERFKLFGGKK